MIEAYGWSEMRQRQFEAHAREGLLPARVIAQHRALYRIVTCAGELSATLSGRFSHGADEGALPVAGDWLAVAARASEGTATVHAVLPRTSVFVRRQAGAAGGSQTVAANVDVALLATSLDADFSPRRVERYLAAARSGGARPLIVLTKADRCLDVASHIEVVTQVAADVQVVTVSALTGKGMEALAAQLAAGETACLLGSSGVGKSTLLNVLAGRQVMETNAVREDDGRGRHTTTHRELVLLASGALVLDTPGMRELGLWNADAGVATTFADIEELSRQCRFNDCAHGGEPCCAVRAALSDGSLAADRFASFTKLHRELQWLERKENPHARIDARKVWIRRAKNNRARMKHRYDDD